MESSSFKFILPLAITDAVLVSSSIPETVAATYSGATAYVIGDRVGLAPVNGSAQTVYECIQNSTGNALPVPPATTTAYWKAVGDVYPLYSGAVTYALGAIVSNIGTNIHELYESLAAGNVGNPLTDPLKWVLRRPTNRWAMFDEVANSTTVSPDSNIVVVLAPNALINALATTNLRGASMRVQQSGSGYDSTFLLNNHIASDWYGWYYDPLAVRDDVAVMDIPPYPTSNLTITLSASYCGILVLGQQYAVGTTLSPLSRTINDYSRIVEDTWGGLVLSKGTYSKRMSVSVFVEPGYESQAVHLLTDIRATPVVFVAGDSFDSAIIYGILGRGWTVPMNLTGGTAQIEIQGMT